MVGEWRHALKSWVNFFPAKPRFFLSDDSVSVGFPLTSMISLEAYPENLFGMAIIELSNILARIAVVVERWGIQELNQLFKRINRLAH